jgi:alpha-tubulin suppressor-like RCC1 family protein
MSRRSSKGSSSKNNKRKRKEESEDDDDDDDDESVNDDQPIKRLRSIREIIKSEINEDKTSKIVDIMVFGDNTEGVLGTSADNKDESKVPVLVTALENTNVLDAVCGSSFNLIIETSNNEDHRRVWSWGYNQEHELGRNAEKGKEHMPGTISGLDKKFIVQVSAGDSHAAALTIEGQVYTWGIYKSEKEFMGFKPGRPESEPQDIPELLEDHLKDKKVIQVCSCKSRTLALTETGEVYEWGFIRMLNKIPQRHLQQRLLPQIVIFPEKVIALYGTHGEMIFAKSVTNKIYAWGNNNCYQLGIDNWVDPDAQNAPKKPKAKKGEKTTEKKR